MLGWYLDVLVSYLIRTLVRLVRTLQSKRWNVEKATVSSAVCPVAVAGGPVAEVGYTYIYDGEYYSGIYTKGFLLKDSAQEYVNGIVLGAEIPVRVNPANPERSVFVG